MGPPYPGPIFSRDFNKQLSEYLEANHQKALEASRDIQDNHIEIKQEEKEREEIKHKEEDDCYTITPIEVFLLVFAVLVDLIVRFFPK